MADTISTTATHPPSEGTADTGSAVERARDVATEVASDARREVAAVTSDARQQTLRAAQQTRDQLRTQADEQAKTIAASLRGISGQLTAMGDAPDAGGGVATDVARHLGSTVGRMADTLDTGGVNAAMDDMRRFARNRPVVFLAGAVGAGLLVGRLLRATDVHALVDTAKDGVAPSSNDHATGITTTSFDGPGALGAAPSAMGEPSASETYRTPQMPSSPDTAPYAPVQP